MTGTYYEFHNVTATADTAVGIADYAQRWLARSTWPERLTPVNPRGEGVRITAHEWAYSGAERNWEGPRCPKCRDIFVDDKGGVVDTLEEWFITKHPPVLTCSLCGTSAPITQWDLTRAGVCSYVSMATAQFDDPDELKAQLNRHTSGTWVWISVLPA